MPRKEFEQLVAEEFPNAVPPRFRNLLSNIAVLVEDEPSESVRKEQQLPDEDTLLGYYVGVPLTDRGDHYGLGALPDTITLYQNPIEDVAAKAVQAASHFEEAFEREVRTVIRETIWHEIAHHFGFDDSQVEEREQKGI